MAAMAHWLPPRWNDGPEIVMLNGSTTIRAGAARANTVAERLAETAGGTATILPVPAIVGAAATRTVLEQDPVIGAILDRAAAAPLACFGLGAIDGSVLVESGYLDDQAIAGLKACGAVGDILGRFVDRDGRIVDAGLDARTIGLAPATLRDKAIAIGISAGPLKHGILRACVTAGYVNVIVTDEGSARHLLEETT
jgi:deoxyribonucleoside regulator